MALISIKNLSFYYDGSHDIIFDKARFQMDSSWKLALTGRNGRGKTTLCRLLMGQEDYLGTIASPLRFEYFPFPVADRTQFTIDIIESIAPEAEYWQISRELNLLELSEELLYRAFETLSNGEQTKALLAALFLRENEFLLIDEPTNHLDARGRELVSAYLNRKQGFILISHDRAFLDGCVDHVLAINKGSIEVHQGDFSTWLYNKELRDKSQLAQNEKLGREIKRLEKSAREKAQWSDAAERSKIGIDPKRVEKSAGRRPYEAAKAKKGMKRAKAIEARRQGAISEKSGLMRDVEQVMALKLAPLSYRSETLLSCRELSVSYGGKSVCSDITFELHRGERLALLGRNGSGKSSLLKLLCGAELSHSGELSRPSDLIISVVEQDSSALSGTIAAFAEARGLDEARLNAFLRYLDMQSFLFEKPMESFSAGQRKKVLLAASLCKSAHLYIWDEPLNYIDVISRMQIEQLILDYAPSMIFVEHDAAFCERVATAELEL